MSRNLVWEPEFFLNTQPQILIRDDYPLWRPTRQTRLRWVFFEVFFAVFSQYFFCPPIGKKNSSIELHSIFAVFFAVFLPDFRDTIRLGQRWEVTFARTLTNKQQYQHNKHSNLSSSSIIALSILRRCFASTRPLLPPLSSSRQCAIRSRQKCSHHVGRGIKRK